MSGITLRDYMSSASLDQTGTIRTTHDDASQLVNKGTLGNRIASWFQQKFGNVDQNDKAKRQQDALDGFRDALAGTYGTEVAKLALAGIEDYGRTENPRLTGRMISVAVNNASAIATGNKLANAGSVNNLLPPPRGGTATPEFRTLVETLGDGMTPEQLSPKELTEFEARFRSRTASLDLNSGRLHAQIQDIARQTLAEVHKLAGAGRLDAASTARQEIADTLKEIIRLLADGRSPAPLMPMLTYAARWLERLAHIEDFGDGAQGQQGDVRQQARNQTMEATQAILGQVVRELSLQDPGVLGRAQENALARGSSLRAILAQMGEQPGDQLSPRQQGALDRIADMSAAIVHGLAKLRGPETVSPESDVKRLQSTEDLSGSKKSDALRPVNRLLNWITDNPTAPAQFINRIKLDYAITNAETGEVTWKNDPLGFPKWNSVQLLENLEHHVRHYAVQDRLTIDTAIANMRAAIDQDATLPPGLKSKLAAGLDAILEEFMLRAKVAAGDFHNLKQEDFWHLFVPQRLVDENVSKWDIEQREQGSLAGMQRAFRQMLETRKVNPQQPLTGGELENLHVEATGSCFRGGMLRMTYRDDFSDEDKQPYADEAPLRPGYRNRETFLVLREDTETTPEGLAELRLPPPNGEAPWFQLHNDNLPNEIRLTMLPKTRQQCGAYANQVLANFYQQLPNQQTDNDKRLLVAETVQTLYRAHLFEDGNSRAVVFTAMNRLLLDAGMSPAILPEPKGAGGFSRQQFADEIRKGQIAYQLLTKPDNVGVADLLKQQLDRMEAEDTPRETGVTILRGLIDGNEGLPLALRTEALHILDAEALRLEGTFYARLQEQPGLAGLRREEVWRLFGSERLQSVDQTDPLPQLERAFQNMLLGMDLDLPLDARHLEIINREGPTPGYRAGLDRDDCRAEINQILNDYRERIALANTDQAKRLVIAEAVNRLYEDKYFPDNQSQFTVLIAMNRMLLDAGLSPCLLQHPTMLGLDHVGDVAHRIDQGQLAFRWHARSAETPMPMFLLDEAQKLAAERKITLPEAWQTLRNDLADNSSIPEQTRAEMVRRITQILDEQPNETQVEDGLRQQIKGVDAYAKVPPTEVWRLITIGNEHNDRKADHTPSREAFVKRHGIDHVLAMERAYGVMLDGHKKNAKLDVDQVLAINQAGPNPGLRQKPIELVVDYGQWLFADRPAVGRLLRDDPWYAGGTIREIQRNGAAPYHVVTLPGVKSPEAASQKLQSILDTYHTEIEQADTDDAKRQVIVKVVQAMYRAQIFDEGERQSTVLAVLNRMLLDAGMSPCIFSDPSLLFGITPPVIRLLINGGQKFFDTKLFPPPIEDFDLETTGISKPSIDDDSADDARVTQDARVTLPSQLHFATIDGHQVADARELMSLDEWTAALSNHTDDLATDVFQRDLETRNTQRQQKLDGRDLRFSRNGEPIALRNAEEVPNIVRSSVDLRDVVIDGKTTTAEDAANGLARFLDPGLFDRLHATVVSKYAPDQQIDPPQIEFSIQMRQDDNNRPLYDITMRAPMPDGTVGDDPFDLVVTLEVDATTNILYDRNLAHCRLESRL